MYQRLPRLFVNERKKIDADVNAIIVSELNYYKNIKLKLQVLGQY